MKNRFLGSSLLMLTFAVAPHVHAQELAKAPAKAPVADSPPVLWTSPDETPAQHAARLKWFHAARFGMFIHRGVYAVPAGVYKDKRYGSYAEWIKEFAKIPGAEYRQYGPQFTAEIAEHEIGAIIEKFDRALGDDRNRDADTY